MALDRPDAGVPDEPVPASPAQTVSSNLSDVLRAAPDLKVAPGVALAVARYGGPVTENAQQVAGVAKSRSIETGVTRVSGDVGPDAEIARLEAQGFSPGTGLTGEIAGAATKVGQAIGSIPTKAAQLATGVNPKTGQGPGPGGIAPGVTTPQLTAGMQSQVGGDVKAVAEAASPNQIMQVPSHIFRYAYDVRARHGNAAMLEALAPMIGGAVAGYALTHSAQGAEEGEEAAAETTGAEAETETAAPEEAAAPAEGGPRPGQGRVAKGVTKAVLRPAVEATRVATRAGTAVSTSPVALGAQGAGEISGRILYPDSFKRTADATTWKLPDGQIGPTFGRAVAGAAGLTKGSEAFNALSGTLDAFMYAAVPDPVGAAGRVYGKATSAEGFGESFLGKHVAGGTAPITPAGVEAAVTQYPKISKAMDDIASMSPAQIAEEFPILAHPVPGSTFNMLYRLGEAKTRDDVIDVFKEAARTQELVTADLPRSGPYLKAKQMGRTTTSLFRPAATTFNPEAMRFTGKTMNLGKDDAIPAVGNLLRAAGEKETVVRQVMDTMAGTRDMRTRITIVRNAFKTFFGNEVLRAMDDTSLPDDAKGVIMDKMDETLTDLFGGSSAGHAGQFGSDMTGADLSRVYNNADDADDKSRAAGLYLSQAGEFKIPPVRQIKYTIAKLAKAEQWTAKNAVLTRGLAFEDLIDHTINEDIFQPLALATAGWATRVSVSEVALNVLRQGPLNFTAGRIAASAAKQNWALSTEEMPHFVAAVRGVLAGIDESAVRALGKERILDAATASIKVNNGHVLAPATDATHAPPIRGTDQAELAGADVRAMNRRLGKGPGVFKVKNVGLMDTYNTFAPGATGYFRSWSEWLGMIAHDPIGETAATAYKADLDAGNTEAHASAFAVDRVKRFLDTVPPEDISHMERNAAMSREGTDLGSTPHQDWAVQVVKDLKGKLYGPDGTFHAALLNDIVDKTVPDVKGMIARYADHDPASLPRSVPGREANLKTGGIIQRASNTLHSKFLGPIVNQLSREPTYVVDFANERDLLAPLVKRGQMTQDQADVLAQVRASYDSIRFVHNPIDRLKVENMLHIFAPFYFAQNQALRRAGRLLAQNPGAFEQYMKLMLGINDVSAQITDKNGEPEVIVPGSTLGGEGISEALHWLGISPVGSIPIGLTGAADPSTTVNPFSTADSSAPLASALTPSIGPTAAIPLKSVTDLVGSRAPTITDIANKALGPVSTSEPLWTQLMPNSILQHAAEGTEGWLSQGQNSFGSSYTTELLSVMASMAEAGNLPTAQQLAGGGYPNNSQAKATFIKQANNITGIMWLGRTLAAGASPVSLSLGQANLAFTNMAQDYINKAGGNVGQGLDAMTKAHPNLVPSEVFKSASSTGTDTFAEVNGAAKWITANKPLVEKYPSASFWLMPNQDNKGQFSDSAYNMELALGLRHKLTPSDFFDQIYIAAGNAYYFDTVSPQLKKALAENPGDSYNIYDKLDADLQKYGSNVNPIWYDYWQGDQSLNAKQQVVAQMKTMLADPSTPKSPLATHVGYLVNAYDQFQGEKTSGQYTSTQLKDRWTSLMTAATQKYPDTKSVVQSVFVGLG